MQDSKELTERLGKYFSVTDFTVACYGKTDTDADDALLSWTGFLSVATYSHVVVCPGQIDRLALMG